MKVLGIESSCDETGVAVYDLQAGLLGHVLHSQIALHKEYGGVVPELASRDHLRHLLPLINDLLAKLNLSLGDLDAIAYTEGPGLGGALLVGSTIAQTLAYALDTPIIPIHHLEAHLLSPLMDASELDFPFVALLVSGGHTQLMDVKALGDYTLLGETLDDAVGEAFDKAAKLMGLDYPGGPILAKLAEYGNPTAFAFPRPMLHQATLDMSFAGLKTAVLTAIQQIPQLDDSIRQDLAASFQAAAVDVLVHKAQKALKHTGYQDLVVAGGVGANLCLRERLNASCPRVHYPAPWLCTDNGAMIAYVGALRLQHAQKAGGFSIKPRWSLHDIPKIHIV